MFTEKVSIFLSLNLFKLSLFYQDDVKKYEELFCDIINTTKNTYGIFVVFIKFKIGNEGYKNECTKT